MSELGAGNPCNSQQSGFVRLALGWVSGIVLSFLTHLVDILLHNSLEDVLFTLLSQNISPSCRPFVDIVDFPYILLVPDRILDIIILLRLRVCPAVSLTRSCT